MTLPRIPLLIGVLVVLLLAPGLLQTAQAQFPYDWCEVLDFRQDNYNAIFPDSFFYPGIVNWTFGYGFSNTDPNYLLPNHGTFFYMTNQYTVHPGLVRLNFRAAQLVHDDIAVDVSYGAFGIARTHDGFSLSPSDQTYALNIAPNSSTDADAKLTIQYGSPFDQVYLETAVVEGYGADPFPGGSMSGQSAIPCGAATATPTQTPTASNTPTPYMSPTPSVTPTPSDTPTASNTPLPADCEWTYSVHFADGEQGWRNWSWAQSPTDGTYTGSEYQSTWAAGWRSLALAYDFNPVYTDSTTNILRVKIYGSYTAGSDNSGSGVGTIENATGLSAGDFGAPRSDTWSAGVTLSSPYIYSDGPGSVVHPSQALILLFISKSSSSAVDAGGDATITDLEYCGIGTNPFTGVSGTSTPTQTPTNTPTFTHTPGPSLTPSHTFTPTRTFIPATLFTPPPLGTLPPPYTNTPIPTSSPGPTTTFVPSPTRVMTGTPDLTGTPTPTPTPGGGGGGGGGPPLDCAGTILGPIGCLLQTIGDFFSWLINTVLNFLAWLLSLIRWLIATVGNLFQLLINFLQGLWDFLQWLIGLINQLIQVIGLILNIIVQLLETFVGWLFQWAGLLGRLLGAYGVAVPTPIAPLWNCVTEPLLSDVCATYYLVQYTILGGTLGDLILRVLLIIMDMNTVFYVIVTVRNLLNNAKEVTKG